MSELSPNNQSRQRGRRRFSPRRRPSFAELVSPEAAAKYGEEKLAAREQELVNIQRTRKLGSIAWETPPTSL